jgi:chemotaxis protein MotB
MASYMDMVTVLMCLFIVLFAMSAVDADKFEKLRLSLSTGFGTIATDTVDTAAGIVVPPELVGQDGDVTSTPPAQLQAEAELDYLLDIQHRINSSLVEQGLAPNANYEITERGLIVRLVGAETFFGGNSVELGDTANQVLGSIGTVLASIPEEIVVEGHADPNGSSAPYATDWELSSGRATQVVRFLTERSGIAASRAGAIGFGSARPLSSDLTAAGTALNRRVDVVVLSSEPDVIRDLLPDVLAGRSETTTVSSG